MNSFYYLTSIFLSIGLLFNVSHALPSASKDLNPKDTISPNAGLGTGSIDITQSFDVTLSLVSQQTTTIQTACQADSTSAVLNSLSTMHSALTELSRSFVVGAMFSGQMTMICAQKYAQLLMQFQLLIQSISTKPMIAASCRPLLRRYTIIFMTMNRYFNSCGINLAPMLQQQGGFNSALWGGFGFSFEFGGSVSGSFTFP